VDAAAGAGETAGTETADSAVFVQSFARGLDVIRAFGAEHPRLSLADVARSTGLNRATARRFLLTLEQLGYIRLSGREFSLTPRVLELGFSYLSALSIPEIAQPHLEELSRAVGESSSVSVLDGAEVVYVARVPARRLMSVSITVGTRLPAFATSMGRVLLAALPPAEAELRLTAVEFTRFTSTTLTDRVALLGELREVSQRGWGLVDQELESGLRSIAAPLRRGGEVVAALNVSSAAGAEAAVDARERLLGPLLETAEAISRELDSSRGSV
jgi:IclR family pca regulon transcriptional regulator